VGLGTGRFSGNGCGSRIPVAVDLSELDRLMADSAPAIVPEGGFTLKDMTRRYGISITTATRRVKAMIEAGQMEFVGYRPGTGREKVYRVVTPVAHGGK
jgi:DNA-binding MarR family transcriptional regulator